jgi:hypothetical protein
MVSASKAARQAKREADGKPKKTAASKLSSRAGSKSASKASSVDGDAEDLDMNEDVKKLTLYVYPGYMCLLEEPQHYLDGISQGAATRLCSDLHHMF